MPRYDYRCSNNGRTVEVSHPMNETVSTWGELCRLAGIEPGATPSGAPVERVLSVPLAISKSEGPQRGSGGPCGPSCGCHPH